MTVDKVVAREGSHQASNIKNRFPMKVGKLPHRPLPKMQFYEIADRPWQGETSKHQKEAQAESIYAVRGLPDYTVTSDMLMGWENITREDISILLHTDHFIAAGSRLFEVLYDHAECGVELEEEFIWNVARQGICMMHNAGMTIQDLVRNNIWLAGDTMFTCRDA